MEMELKSVGEGSDDVDEYMTTRISYEEAVKRYGTGRYQLLVCALLSLVTWSTAVGNESYNWICASMNYSCKLPENIPNATFAISHEPSVSLEYSAASDQCTYDLIKSVGNDSRIVVESGIPCKDWIYDTTYFDSTIVSEWDMNKCTSKLLVPLVGSLFMAGFLVGCFVFGDLSDRFGRRTMFLVSHIGLIGFGLGATFSINLAMLVVMRFAFGMCVAGARNSGFVYMAEILEPRLRAWTGPVTSVTYWAAAMLFTATAQFVRDWRNIQLTAALVCLWFIPYYWYLHESPHWLLAQNRQKECIMYFKRSARFNNKDVPKILEIYHEKETIEKRNVYYLDFFRKKNIFFVTLVICMAWFCVSAVAFGFSYNVGNMTGNIFTNMYITLAGGPLVPLAVPIMRLGRRVVIVFGFILTGLMAISVAIMIPYESTYGVSNIAIPIFTGLGRALSSFSFSGLYVITSEVYATNMRVTALGLGSAFARFGGVVAPYLAYTSDLSKSLPYILFGCLSFMAASLCLMLPETINKKLPITVQDMNESFHLRCPCQTESSKEESIKL